jgi:formylglycine-generating enzyme required for sulfatase activity
VEERRIEASIPKEHLCRFADRADVLQHDILVELVRDMDAFFDPMTGTFNNVKRRRLVASHIKKDSIDRYRDRWQTAIAAIRDATESPQYGGLVIKEQLGLVPLGPDPDSGLWEFGQIQTGKIPLRKDDGTLAIDDESGIVFVLLPGGLTTIGARPPANPSEIGEPFVDPLAAPEERPVQTVTLSPFLISKYEMTQAQWQRATGSNPSRYQPNHGPSDTTRTNPVENISWESASNVLWQLGASLPTEAQWEFATRGWTLTPWWTGGDPASLAGAANMADASYIERGGQRFIPPGVEIDDGYAAIHAPVGQFRANPFGLHDVLGNVAEWCVDAFGSYDHKMLDAIGKRRSGPGEAGHRVIRGGSFEDGTAELRSSARGRAAIEYRAGTLGVRPVRMLSN